MSYGGSDQKIIAALQGDCWKSGFDIGKEARLGPAHLYPTLNLMERQGIIESKWANGNTYPRRRLYHLNSNRSL